MRVSGTSLQKFLLGMALLCALAWNLVHASEIKNLRVQSGATGTRAEVVLDQSAEFKVISLSAPDRLVVDLPATRLRTGVALPAGAGVVKSVRSGQPAAGVARIVFDLAEPVAVLTSRMEHDADGGARLVVEWPGDGDERTSSGASVAAVGPKPPVEPTSATAADSSTTSGNLAASNAATTRLISELVARAEVRSASAAPATTPASTGNISAPAMGGVAAGSTTAVALGTAAPAATQSLSSSAPRAETTGTVASAPTPDASKTGRDALLGTGMPGNLRGMRPLVIAIDPGHGGQDPGASGPSGKREKDVTLAIARELARQINATPGLRAYLTRDTDVFIPLERRAQLARQARADMFVSIHADAAENRNAKGSSVYVLSLKGASSQRARWLADKENASDLIGGVRLEKTSSTLASVLVDLTQSGQMKASEDAAGHVLAGLGRVGNTHKPNIERANFAVLRTSDMPAMLVETAFISNPEEERRLIDAGHQRRIAQAVLDGVNTYFQRQPPPGTLYAARAAVETTSGAGAGAAAGSR